MYSTSFDCASVTTFPPTPAETPGRACNGPRERFAPSLQPRFRISDSTINAIIRASVAFGPAFRKAARASAVSASRTCESFGFFPFTVSPDVEPMPRLNVRSRSSCRFRALIELFVDGISRTPCGVRISTPASRQSDLAKAT